MSKRIWCHILILSLSLANTSCSQKRIASEFPLDNLVLWERQISEGDEYKKSGDKEEAIRSYAGAIATAEIDSRLTPNRAIGYARQIDCTSDKQLIEKNLQALRDCTKTCKGQSETPAFCLLHSLAHVVETEENIARDKSDRLTAEIVSLLKANQSLEDRAEIWIELTRLKDFLLAKDACPAVLATMVTAREAQPRDSIEKGQIARQWSSAISAFDHAQALMNTSTNQALDELKRSLILARSINDRALEISITVTEAKYLFLLGKINGARESFAHALLLAKAFGDRNTEVKVLQAYLKTLHLNLNPATFEELSKRKIALLAQHPGIDSPDYAEAILELADHYVSVRNLRLAKQFTDKAALLFSQCQGNATPHQIAALELLKGHLSQELSDHQAVSHFNQALTNLKAGAPNPTLARQSMAGLAAALAEEGKSDQAIAAYEKCLKLATQALPRAHFHRELAELYLQKNDIVRADQYLADGLALCKNGESPALFRLTWTRAKILVKKNRLAEARDSYIEALALGEHIHADPRRLKLVKEELSALEKLSPTK